MEIQFTTWDVLKTLNTSAPVDIVLKRTPRSENRYKQHKKTINMDINKYLLNKIFGNRADDTFVLTENTFPYNVEKTIEHLILWINPKSKPSRAEIDNYIKNQYKNHSAIYFENVDKNKSVPGIRHFQLFIKPENKNQEQDSLAEDPE